MASRHLFNPLPYFPDNFLFVDLTSCLLIMNAASVKPFALFIVYLCSFMFKHNNNFCHFSLFLFNLVTFVVCFAFFVIFPLHINW